MYSLVLTLHSWIRWLVVLGGLAVAVRAAHAALADRDYTSSHAIANRLFLGVLDVQVMLGLSLYVFFSPLTPSSIAALKAAMPIAGIRFFAIEHITMMVLASIAAHGGYARAKRATTDRARHRRIAIGTWLALVLIAIAIPWPSRPYGRPLLRGVGRVEAPDQRDSIIASSYCAIRTKPSCA